MRRQVIPELIDDPALDLRERERSLAYVRTTNRRFGGVESLLARLREYSVRWPKDRPVTLLDVGTGSADLPLAARRWAAQAGYDLRITAIDSCEPTLEIAARLVGNDPGITLRYMDAADMPVIFGERSFDYVHAGLFLHHFNDAEVPDVLSAMDRIARVGVIWNDIFRTTRGWLVWYLVTMFQPRIVRHDARASYRAGFTRDEVMAHARAAGIDYASYSFNYHWQRFTLAGERPGCWERPAPARDAKLAQSVHGAVAVP
jgi:hypothetical protein